MDADPDTSTESVQGTAAAIQVCLPSPSPSTSPICGPQCENEPAYGGVETTGCIDSLLRIRRRLREPIPRMRNFDSCIEKLAAWKKDLGTLTVETIACTALSSGAEAAKMWCESGRLSTMCLNMMAEPYVKICLAGMEAACVGLDLSFN